MAFLAETPCTREDFNGQILSLQLIHAELLFPIHNLIILSLRDIILMKVNFSVQGLSGGRKEIIISLVCRSKSFKLKLIFFGSPSYSMYDVDKILKF